MEQLTIVLAEEDDVVRSHTEDGAGTALFLLPARDECLRSNDLLAQPCATSATVGHDHVGHASAGNGPTRDHPAGNELRVIRMCEERDRALRHAWKPFG